MTLCQLCNEHPATLVVWQRDENWIAKVCEECSRGSGFRVLEKESEQLKEENNESTILRDNKRMD